MRKPITLEIVIAARNEVAKLAQTLKALYLDAGSLRLSVYLALNGEQLSDMLSLAHEAKAEFLTKGHEFVVLQCAGIGKAHALNTADQARDQSKPVLYLDADCQILPRTLSAICTALDHPRPSLVAPPLYIVRSKQLLPRAYFEVWQRLPNMVDDVVGAGCFAVNPAGRKLWDAFPETLPDDAYVRSLFPKQDRNVVAEGGFYFVTPLGPKLLPTIRRWSAGNAAVGMAKSLEKKLANRTPWIIRDTRIWKYLPIFVLVKTLTALPGTRMKYKGDWMPARAGLPVRASYTRPKIALILVTFQNENQIEACLRSIESLWTEIDITVIDNASLDGTVGILRSYHRSIRLIENQENLGFAAAVNQAVQQAPKSDFVLLLNPDVVLAPTAIDALVAAAVLRPECGLYGGQMLDGDGKTDGSNCLNIPSLRSALAFAMGPIYPWYSPDQLGGWPRDDIRTVPILTGGFLLIDQNLWSRLRGLSEVYYLYGEDVDFSMRAVTLGAAPLFTPNSIHTHTRGSSHNSRTEMTIKTLTGKISLFDAHLAGWKTPPAKFLLRLGVRLRALAQGEVVADSTDWKAVLDRKEEWRNGW